MIIAAYPPAAVDVAATSPGLLGGSTPPLSLLFNTLSFPKMSSKSGKDMMASGLKSAQKVFVICSSSITSQKSGFVFDFAVTGVAPFEGGKSPGKPPGSFKPGGNGIPPGRGGGGGGGPFNPFIGGGGGMPGRPNGGGGGMPGRPLGGGGGGMPGIPKGGGGGGGGGKRLLLKRGGGGIAY